MPIKLTVKTLDSRNHVLDDVDEESTVKDFKEKIASTVGIEANLQRLIYCGRVLNDEKQLKEYGLDGKVVHLVQRPPPTGGPDRLAASEARARSRGASPSHRRQHIQITHGPTIQGNPASMGQPSALVRLNLARSMINRAIGVLDDLEGVPEDQRTRPTTSTTTTTATANVSVVTAGIPMDQVGSQMAFGVPQAFGGMPAGLAQAIETAVSSAINGENLNNGHTISFQVGPDGQLIQSGGTGGSRPTPTTSSTSTPRRGNNVPSSPGRRATNNSTPTSPVVDHPPPSVMAEVMQLYRTTQQRLDSHWDRVTTMLNDDPVFENEAATQEHQRLFKMVTEVMHFLSHAQHAISDIMLNTSSAPPRQLRARPFIIQSAMVSSAAVVRNIPFALPGTRNPAAQRSSSASRATSGGQTQTQTQTQSQTPASNTPASASASASASTSSEAMETDQPQQQQQQPTTSRPATPMSRPPAVEVMMEPILLGIEVPPEIAIDATTGRIVNNGGGNQGGRGLLENLVQAAMGGALGGVQQVQPASSEATSSSSATTATQQEPATTQDSRARVSSQTQPTTSTRTRLSTMVVDAPMGPPMFQFGPHASMGQPHNNFDILLPCNSHHVPSSGGGARIRTRQVIDRPRSASMPPDNRRSDRPGQLRNNQSAQRQSPLAAGSDDTRMDADHAGIEESLRSLVSSLLEGNGIENEPQMLSVLQQILQQIFTPEAGGSNSSQTVANFLENISDYNYTFGQDFVTDLLMSLARVLTFTDLIGLLSGSTEVVGRVQRPLQQFMRQRMSLGTNDSVPTDDEINEAIVKLLDDSYPQLEVFAQSAHVTSGVNYPETLHAFLSDRLVQMAKVIWQTPPDAFAEGFYSSCQLFAQDLIYVSSRCFTDGQQSIERLLRAQLSTMSQDIGSDAVGSWATSTAVGHLRNLIAGMSSDGHSDLYQDCVMSGIRESVSIASRQRRIRQRKQEEATDDEKFETPRTSPEAMDVSQDEEEAKPSSQQSRKAPDSKETERFPTELLSRSSMGPDMAVGRETWHRSVPQEWVPVITRDVHMQDTMARQGVRQAPYSDAYLTTIPSKKRRIAASRKLEGSVENVIENTMSDAIRASGVKPKTSKEDVAQSASSDGCLRKHLTDNATESLKRRIKLDKDYDPKKHPNCSEYMNKH